MITIAVLIMILTALGTWRKYKTIMLDPPWDINQKGKLGAINHYNLMTLDQIRNLPIPELAADDAHLWLWVPNGLVPEAIQLIKDWGFTYRNSFYWIKPRLGLGVYLRNASETVLFATRGKAPVLFKGQPNWLFAPLQDHSHKPEEMYEVIERVSPGPYLELFARRHRHGWDSWGNEIDSDIYIPDYPVPRYSESAVLPDDIPRVTEESQSETQEEVE